MNQQYRFMRIILFFDLPTESADDRREYRRFRRLLIKSGFIMMQESVYCKLALNSTVVKSVIKKIKKSKPQSGLVQVLVITEKQFSRIEYICGEKSSEFIDSDQRLVIL